MEKHTPQPPLSLDSEGDIIDAEGHLLAVITLGGKSLTNMFLASPDLLEFARQVVEFAANHSNFYLMAWAQDVVSKAEGKQ
jgi:hypothetical protein